MVNLLIGCTGSVASLKLPVLLEEFRKDKNINVKVVVTKFACHFFNLDQVRDGVEVFTDDDEWNSWTKRGDPVVHIELTKWADLFLIAPLDANTLAKISNGICDNLLTCCVRAWDISKSLLFCPAMNTKMFNHPLTESQIKILLGWGYILIPTVEKTLVCGDTGNGAMAEVETIVSAVRKLVIG